jgi:hypothetical protein
MIKEEHVKELENINLVYKKTLYPIPHNKYLPLPYFLSLYCGGRGAGKTWGVCQLLKQYEASGLYDPNTNQDVQQRIILISPTVHANPVFTSLKYLDEKDIYTKYSDGRLKKIVNDIENQQKETKEYQRKLKIYKKFIKNKKLDQDEIFELEMNNYEHPTKPQFETDPINFLVLDDCLGSAAFRQGKSPFTAFAIKNRHYKTCVLILTQNLKGIPKSLRINVNLFILFKFSNKKVLLDMYDEVENLLTEDEFMMLYNYATQDSHDCLVLDFTNGNKYQFRKNYNKILEIE